MSSITRGTHNFPSFRRRAGHSRTWIPPGLPGDGIGLRRWNYVPYAGYERVVRLVAGAIVGPKRTVTSKTGRPTTRPPFFRGLVFFSSPISVENVTWHYHKGFRFDEFTFLLISFRQFSHHLPFIFCVSPLMLMQRPWCPTRQAGRPFGGRDQDALPSQPRSAHRPAHAP